MFADIDHKHPQVRYDLFYWVQWLRGQMKIGGLRLDAIKHYSASFLRDLLAHIDERVDENWFLVGEYWREDSEFLAKLIEYMGHRMSLFDVQLVANLSRISSLGEKGDLREVFDDALVLWKPEHAVVSTSSSTYYQNTSDRPDLCRQPRHPRRAIPRGASLTPATVTPLTFPRNPSPPS